MKKVLLVPALLFVAAGCRRPQAPDSAAVVATYTGGTILRAEIRKELETRLGKDPSLKPEGRRELVRTILGRRSRRALLLKEAETTGFTVAPRTVLHLKVREHAILASDWVQRHVEPNVVVPPGRIEKEVARVSADKGAESRAFSHIYLKADANDVPAMARAKRTMAAIRQELAEGRAFDDLARARSDSVTSRGGGQIGATLRSQLKEPLAETVFSLAEGQVSEPVETPDGLHLFRVDRILRPPARRLEELRASVTAELRGEALRAATDAERARAVDESGLVVDARALVPGASPSAVVVDLQGPLTRAELDDLVETRAASGGTLHEAARWLVANWQLARKRRREPVDDTLSQRLSLGHQDVVLSLYREILVRSTAAPVTPEEEVAFWEKGKETLPFLREKEVDLLFLPQHGDDVAGVYAAGEAVVHALRGGTGFDAILGGVSRPKDAVVARRLSLSPDVVRQASSRVSQALGRLRREEVSPAIYVQEEKLTPAGATPVTRGRGVLFLRLVGERATPLETARPLIHQHLEEQKRADAIAAIKHRLDQEAHLTILQPEG